MNKPTLRDHVLPTKFTGVVSASWFRQFSFSERLRVLLGYNLAVEIRIVTQHSPGKFQSIVVGETSRNVTASSHVQERLQDVLAKVNESEELNSRR